MKRFGWFALLLITLVGFQTAAAQSEFHPGDKVIVTAQLLPVYAAADLNSSLINQKIRGFVGQVITEEIDDSGKTWVYLLDGAYGWVELGDPANLIAFSDEALAQIGSEASDAIAADEKDMDAYLTRATVALSQKNYDAAIADFTHVVELTPNEARFYFERARAYVYAEQIDKAEHDAEQATMLQYKLPEFFVLRGAILRTMGDYDNARALCHQAVVVAPDYGDAYACIGANYTRIADAGKSLENDAMALQLDPNDLYIYVNQGLGYGRLGKFDQELERYNTVIARAPFFAQGYVKRGGWYADHQDFAHAMSDYSSAITLDPENASLYDSRGITYIQLGDTQNAISDLKKAISLNSFNDHAHYTLALLDSSLGYYDEALTQYTIVIDMGRYYAFATLLYRPQIYIALGQYAEAELDLINFQEQSTDDYFSATSLILRASVLARLENYRTANTELTQLLDTQPDFGKNYYIMGSNGYRATPLREQMIISLQQRVSQQPQNADLHLQLALISMEFGLWQQAYDSFSTYKQLSGKNDNNLNALLGSLQQLAS